ncbi:hypothetical protein [Caudoviricetes sp.]|nr:hypothetical protein [Caudoviricetes sp.]
MQKQIFSSTIALVLFTTLACGPFPKPDASKIIECATQDQAALIGMAARLEPLLYGDSPDWQALQREAEVAGVAIGGCVLADLLNQWLARPRALEDSHGAWDTLESVRKYFGGVRWRVAGDVI